jgi:hypothetical protein
MSLRKFRADKIKYPVYTGTTIAKDDLVAINALGYAIPATDTAGLRFVGVCAKGVANAGASGAKEVEVHRTGVISMAATSIAATQIGDAMYVVDKNTFDETTGNSIACGILVKRISGTVGWLYFGPGGITKPVSADDAYTTTYASNVQALALGILLSTELKTDMLAHAASLVRHAAAQSATVLAAVPLATDLASLKVLVAALKVHYAAHNADAILGSGWTYHSAQAADKVLATIAAPTTMALCLSILNDMKAKFNDHEDETTGHKDGSASITAHQIIAADMSYGAAVKVSDARIQADDLIYWSILNDGTGNVTGVSAVASDGYITFTFSGNPYEDTIISYQAVRL